MWRRPLPLCLLLITFFPALGVARGSGPRAAPAEQAERARLPVRVIAGRLVARCEVSTKFRRIPVNLFVDFGRACGLELHNRAAHGIKVDVGGGQPIQIHLSGFNIGVERREHGDEQILDDFTKLYSKELGETACVGAIGLNILRDYHVVFDLRAGFLFLEKPHEKTDTPPEEVEGTVLNAITLTNDQIWIPVRLADKRVLSMNIATSRFDTLVDEDICEEMGQAAGDIGAVHMKTIELTQYVALRPAELAQVHADGVLGTIGLNILRHFRVTVDRVNRYVRFEPTVEPSFPKADRVFFAAMVEEDVGGLRAFLKKHGDTRLGREAAELLLTLLVDSGEPAANFQEALAWMDKTRIDDLRSTEALTTMKMLLEARRPEVAIAAGKIGVESGRKDRYPESVHKLHAKLGELLLVREDPTEAWEHLLSAAFGLPHDGMINLNLGRFYERQKRYKRAMSRYVQAVIKPESGPLAIQGLERVQKATGGAPLSVDLVNKLIAGKVYNFGAATRFKADKSTDNNRCVLVEMFTNPHLARRLPEGWRSFNVGGVMGQEGLLSHFPRERVAMLTYFVEEPEPCALMTEVAVDTAQRYDDERPVYMMINGVSKGPGAGRSRDAEKIYNRNRATVLDALRRGSKYDMAADVQVENGVVKGTIKVQGPENGNARLQIVLAERGVLYPGKGLVVVHRMVARGVLTKSVDGAALKMKDGAMTFAFERSLADMQKDHEAWLTKFEKRTNKSATRLSTRIDPRQVSVVAFLRHELSQSILQAVHADATQPRAGGPK